MRKLIYRNNKGQELTLGSSRPFYLETIENYANISTNISTSDNVDGINIENVSIKERLLPVTGAIYAMNKNDLDIKRAYITALFNPKTKGTITYINDNVTRRIQCVVQDITFQPRINYMQKFLIQFLCPNPFWQNEHEEKTEIALWVGDFEFPLEVPIDTGIEMGHRVSNLICNVYNRGDVECGMKIQFRALATVKNPSLFNINTREFIKINQVLNVGDVLEINTNSDNKRIELVRSNGTRENVLHWMDFDSEFLQLSVGDNLFRYNAEAGIDNLEVAIYHNQQYLGV